MTPSILKKFHPFHVPNLKRLGNKHDGGYIVHYPSLKDADCLINYGVGYNVEFEKQFYQATDKPTLAFDPTLKDLRFIFKPLFRGQIIPFLRYAKNYLVWTVKEKKLPNYKISFYEEGISATDTPDYKTFNFHFNQHKLKDKKFIFKIDVDGAEYEVFNDKSIYLLLQNAVQIYIEFHSLDEKLEQVAEIITNLESTHSLIHIHANNYADTFIYQGRTIPKVIEVSFLLNTYITDKHLSTAGYPVEGLDRPCDSSKEDIVLDFFH
jgi:hypothetical protein